MVLTLLLSYIVPDDKLALTVHHPFIQYSACPQAKSSAPSYCLQTPSRSQALASPGCKQGYQIRVLKLRLCGMAVGFCGLPWWVPAFAFLPLCPLPLFSTHILSAAMTTSERHGSHVQAHFHILASEACLQSGFNGGPGSIPTFPFLETMSTTSRGRKKNTEWEKICY